MDNLTPLSAPRRPAAFLAAWPAAPASASSVWEAAGCPNVLVETIGVGQSEIEVRSMTDFFLILMIPGAGDELQGIKRGIIEMVDGMVINKADGENVGAANRARSQYESALRMFAPNQLGWTAPVLTCSALENRGIREVWQMILDHRSQPGSWWPLGAPPSSPGVELDALN